PCLPACRRHGLVVGYIQSGKTANMAALMAKAADAGYKIIIVFAGILNTLRQQTQLRFDQELTGGDQGTWTNNWKNLPHVELWKQNERKNFRIKDKELQHLRAQGFAVVISLLDEEQQQPRYNVADAERAGV